MRIPSFLPALAAGLALCALPTAPAAAAPADDHLEVDWLEARLGPLDGDGLGLRASHAVLPQVVLRLDLQRTEGEDAAYTVFGRHALYEATVAVNLDVTSRTDLMLETGMAHERVEAIALGATYASSAQGFVAGLGVRQRVGQRVGFEAQGRYRNLEGDARLATDVRLLLRVAPDWQVVLGRHVDDEIEVVRVGLRWDY